MMVVMVVFCLLGFSCCFGVLKLVHSRSAKLAYKQTTPISISRLTFLWLIAATCQDTLFALRSLLFSTDCLFNCKFRILKSVDIGFRT